MALYWTYLVLWWSNLFSPLGLRVRWVIYFAAIFYLCFQQFLWDQFAQDVYNWTDLHQVFRIGRNKTADDRSDITRVTMATKLVKLAYCILIGRTGVSQQTAVSQRWFERLNSDVSAALCRNFVRFHPVTPEIRPTTLDCLILGTIRRKLAYRTNYLWMYHGELFNKLSGLV